MGDFKKGLIERFMRYTRFDTMSDETKAGIQRPTTEGEEELQKELMRELSELGLNVTYGKEKVVMGVLEGNVDGAPPLAFMAHVDVSSDVEGNGVNAILHSPYMGGKIVLDGVVIKEEDNPDLKRYIGSDIITSDGTTLLGADDKAGIAIIMEALKYLMDHPEEKHGRIEVFFTPDEETGSGMDEFPYESLTSKVCYTIDGGGEDEIEAECFNAATVLVKAKGEVTHLGAARGRMVNPITVLSKIVAALPGSESPEASDGDYGYYAPFSFEGSLEKGEINIFVRDFEEEGLERRIDSIRKIASAVGSLYRGEVSVQSRVIYHNMAKANREHPEAMGAIREAAVALGYPIIEKKIRGGTDGARLSEIGIPSPNIYTGAHNLHSKSEWLSVSAMEKSLNLVLGIIRVFGERK